MRSSDSRAIAAAGISTTCAAFELLDWSPIRNDPHDLGTDIWVIASDDRRFVRGLGIGVQVKTGPSYFRRPRRNSDGDVEGWWYREDDVEHFEDWVTHGLPHLVVLCDLDDNKEYWVHVTAEAVESTGRGCKILVPRDQTIDRDHFDALLAVAAKQKAAPSLEGTLLWVGSGDVAPGRKLRCALVAPRLLAPHPNAGHGEPIDAVAAVALAAQGRFRDLKRFSEEHESVPDLEDPGPGGDWVWPHRSRRDIHMTSSRRRVSSLWIEHINAPEACAYHRVWFDPASIEDHTVHGFRRVD